METMTAGESGTTTHLSTRPTELRHRSFQLRVVSGPNEGAVATAVGRELSVGTAPGNHLVLTDPLVSRHHLVVQWGHRGYWARDVGSTNGTRISDHVIQAAALHDGSELVIGNTRLVFELLEQEISEPLSREQRWGAVLGESPVMRRLFAVLPRIAQSDATLLIEGETGTGKSVLARAVHDASPRASHPFVVVDGSSIPPTLIESVLFGHEKGSFTGAHAARPGAFESAAGGTVFLDEIGEMPLDLQPKLLRELESRQVQRIGRVDSIPLDVRVIAATNRDLREMVNRGAIRADLYYRLKVVTIEMPPLRERRGDIPGLVAHFWAQLTNGGEPPAEVLSAFAKLDWMGNVRELRNAVERAVVLGEEGQLEPLVPPVIEPPLARSMMRPSGLAAPRGAIRPPAARGSAPSLPMAPLDDGMTFDPNVPFRDAKNQAIARWERWYIRELLAYTNGNLSQAARIVQSDRSYLRKLVRRYADHAPITDVDDADDRDEG
jgi:two-component system, NtrC family, response regulator GlrR